MAYIPGQQSNTGSFVQSTSVWDVARLYEVDIESPEFKELLVRLYQQTNNISIALNTKDSAFYLQEIFQTGQVWFNPASTDPLELRPVFRIVIDTGALGAGLNTVAHGLTLAGTTIKFTKILGAASNTSTNEYFSIPDSNMTVSLDATNVYITNTTGNDFTDSYVVLEYVQF